MAYTFGRALAQTALILFLLKKLKLQDAPPTKLFGILFVIQYILQNKTVKKFLSLLEIKHHEKLVDRVAALALKTSPVKKEYSKLLGNILHDSRPSAQKQWEQFGELITSIPEYGYSDESLRSLVDRLACATEKTVGDDFYSGSIYSYSYMKKKYGDNPTFLPLTEDKQLSLNNPSDYDRLTMSLSELYAYAFQRSYLWNSLHQAEFGIGYWLSYQVIRMAADIYGGNPDQAMGFITTGGTESLMTAVRLYRDWGIVNRNHDIGQGVILAAKSIHASVNKGCIAYNTRIEMLPVDEMGKFDIAELKKAVKRVGNDLICIVGSTPSYTIGVIDPIKEIAEIAHEAGVGCHVDSCLGGFVVNFLDHIETDFFNYPGVTSISCDTHKNGWAPKGSSVLLTKDIPDTQHPPQVNLAFYGAYSIPYWDGGIYGTPNNPGSQHVSHILHAYIAMLRIGKNGYRMIANNIQKIVSQCADIIDEDPRLQLLGDAPANVVAWRISPESGFGKGAVYAMAHEMSKRNIVVSAMSEERLHYCVTGRSSADDSFLKEFKRVVKESTDKTAWYDQEVKAGKVQFPGDAGLYGTMEAAMTPTSENTTSAVEYYSNLVLGNRVAEDSVRAHFYALQDPFKKTEL